MLASLSSLTAVSASTPSNVLACSATGAPKPTHTATVKPVAGKDSAEQIQNAIDAVAKAGGGQINLAAGTFLLDHYVQLKTNVALVGTGPSTVLKADSNFLHRTSPGGGYSVVTTNGAKNVTIANFTADQSSNVLNANNGARLSSYLVEGRASQNVMINGVHTKNPFTYSIAMVNSNRFCIQNSTTSVATSGRYDQLDGVHILDSSDGAVLHNTINQRIGTDGDDGLVAHTIGAPVHDVVYAYNDVVGGNNGDGMQIAVGNYPAYNIRIQNNVFRGSPEGIRTGYYDARTGAVSQVTITGNYIHDLRPGKAFPNGGNAIEMGYFDGKGPVTNVVVSNNHVCNAGAVKVQSGVGNQVNGTLSCAP